MAHLGIRTILFVPVALVSGWYRSLVREDNGRLPFNGDSFS